MSDLTTWDHHEIGTAIRDVLGDIAGSGEDACRAELGDGVTVSPDGDVSDFPVAPLHGTPARLSELLEVALSRRGYIITKDPR